MTEQEAEALAARLTRIWKPEGAANWSVVSSYTFYFQAFLAPEARLNVNCNSPDMGSDGYFLSLQKASSLNEVQSGIILVCHERGFDVRRASQFTEEWLLFFRRGCWLSGCPIEASAHEKVEWVQGFSPQEIEAWNLKI